MASEADHLALANKNHDVLMHLMDDVDRFPEWITVLAFYKAVQVVEAVFDHKHGGGCHGHPARLDALKRRGYQSLFRHYRLLWAASSVARYLYDTVEQTPYKSFTDYRTPEQVARNLVNRRLRAIEDEAVGLLSESGRKQLHRLPAK